MDLNITLDPCTDHEKIKRILDKAAELGFEVVALNTFVDCSSKNNMRIPEPKFINYKASAKKFKILSRITGTIENGEQYQKFLQCPATKKFDIIAVTPVGEKMFQHVCSRTGCDIISLNLAENFGFNFKKTTVGQAINNGLSFEITFRPMLKDQASRRNVISNSQLLVNVLKGRQMIISSGAVGVLELRSVYDAINLGMLFGLQKNEAESAVKNNGNIVLKHAFNRLKTGCGYVSLSGIFKVPKQQGWIVAAYKVPRLTEIENDPGSTPKKPRVDY